MDTLDKIVDLIQQLTRYSHVHVGDADCAENMVQDDWCCTADIPGNPKTL
jgi:hypothetical protein